MRQGKIIPKVFSFQNFALNEKVQNTCQLQFRYIFFAGFAGEKSEYLQGLKQSIDLIINDKSKKVILKNLILHWINMVEVIVEY